MNAFRNIFFLSPSQIKIRKYLNKYWISWIVWHHRQATTHRTICKCIYLLAKCQPNFFPSFCFWFIQLPEEMEKVIWKFLRFISLCKLWMHPVRLADRLSSSFSVDIQVTDSFNKMNRRKPQIHKIKSIKN